MQWSEVCEHPNLRDLPFKIELNEWGQVVMSPVKVYHSAFQGKIARLLPAHGIALAECAIKTPKGTKIADVAWCSADRFDIIKDETECSVAPEICIEVISISNLKLEITEKINLYLAAGACEVWTCNQQGQINFFDNSGQLQHSKIILNFPQQISLLTHGSA